MNLFLTLVILTGKILVDSCLKVHSIFEALSFINYWKVKQRFDNKQL